MRRLAIIGASGHGRVIADIAEKIGYSEIVFLDDDETIHECGGYPVLGRSCAARTIEADVIIGIGNAGVRKRIQESIPDERLATLIHPETVIAESVVIGAGTVVMAGTVINPGVRIGKGCIINTAFFDLVIQECKCCGRSRCSYSLKTNLFENFCHTVANCRCRCKRKVHNSERYIQTP